jgi:hypothetical protein
MGRLSLDPNPEACLPVLDEDFARLRAQYGSSLWSSPEKRCLTCNRQGWFRRRTQAGIVEYDCDCTEQWLLHLWLLNAGIGIAYQRLGLDDVTAISESAQAEVWAYLDPDALPHNLALGRGLMLWSPDRGTGKSLMAVLALKAVLAAGYDGYFTTFTDMLDNYQSSWRDEAQRKWFDRRVRNVAFLVIDDIGREHRSAQVTESMFDAVVRARNAAALPTIITTNLTPEEVQQGYGHNVLSLLSGSLHHVEVKGKDYRERYREELAQDVRDKVSRPVVML